MAQAISIKGVITILTVFLLTSAVDAQTLAKTSDGTGFHVFFRTGWATPYIHFNTGSGWTTSPGYTMTKSNDSTNFPATLGWFRYDFPASTTSLEFVFNNGNGIWDNNGNANYKITVAGTWQMTSSVSTPPSATILTAASDGTGLQVFFQTGWTAPYIHYSSGSAWTSSPGKLMTASTDSTYPASVGWFQYDLGSSQTSLEFVFNNGNGIWDNNNNANYKATTSGRSLTGYAHVVYGSARTTASVTVRTYIRAASATCSYTFNGVKSTSPTYEVTVSLKDDLIIVATCTDGNESWKLELDPVNFIWQNNAVNQPSGMKGGQKGAIVDLFGWPYDDIAQECSDFLGKAGYMGVKINPPQESVLTDAWPQSGQRNPWYFVYQP
ncbi:Alpha-amylase, partial [Phytophthora palmivora]